MTSKTTKKTNYARVDFLLRRRSGDESELDDEVDRRRRRLSTLRDRLLSLRVDDFLSALFDRERKLVTALLRDLSSTLRDRFLSRCCGLFDAGDFDFSCRFLDDSSRFRTGDGDERRRDGLSLPFSECRLFLRSSETSRDFTLGGVGDLSLRLFLRSRSLRDLMLGR